MKELLTIKDLSTGYRLKRGGIKLLHKKLSASIDKGKLIAVLGPNGAGKSTLLKTLLGYIPALAGDVFFEGRNLKDISIKEMATKVSVVLTDKIDDVYLTSQEVIAAARYPFSTFMGRSSANDKIIMNDAIDLTGIRPFLYRKLHTLSDGERQRVMIARALAQDTPLIFLDEPTAFIDSPGKVELMQLLKNIPKNGKSILMTIHDVELALHFADTLWLLGKEGAFETGNPKALIEKGSINKLFDRGAVKFNKETNSFI